MDYLYYIGIIDVFMYGGEKEQKGHKEKKPTEFGKPLFFDIWCEQKLLELLKPFKNRKWKDKVIDS